MLLDIIITLGVMLLYFPPMLIWASEPLLKRFNPVLQVIIFPVSILLASTMIFLLPQATYVFILYFILFTVWRKIIRMMGGSSSDNIVLPIYMCFAVSVLWEWPVQIAIPQNPDALILSLFKALGLLLFINKIWGLGWRLRNWVIIALPIIIALGNILAVLLLQNGVTDPLFWAAHLYRLPWILILTFILSDIYKYQDRNKRVVR